MNVLRWAGRLYGWVRALTPEQTWKAMNLVEPTPEYEITVIRDRLGHLHVLHPMATCREGMAQLADTLGTMANVMMAQARQMPSLTVPTMRVPPPQPGTTTAAELILEPVAANGHGPHQGA